MGSPGGAGRGQIKTWLRVGGDCLGTSECHWGRKGRGTCVGSPLLRHGQLGHGTLEAEPEPRLLEALQGLPMAEVAAGGWHSVCVSGK